MLIPGDQWPIFLYAGYQYDLEDPWKELFRSPILVSVSCLLLFHACLPDPDVLFNGKTYKHIFTSPSSVDKIAKATRSGNARIHGMTHVTLASIAYIATQARDFPVIILFFTHHYGGTICAQFFVCVL